MEKWVLATGCAEELSRLRQEWLRQGIALYIAADVAETASKLYKSTACLLVIIFSEGSEHLTLLKFIREMTKVPILILSRKYGSAEKAAAIEAGAGCTSCRIENIHGVGYRFTQDRI